MIKDVPFLSNVDFSKYYHFYTTAPNGSFSTPYFGEPHNESFRDCGWVTRVHIYVPENLTVGSKIVVDLDYDVDYDNDFEIYLDGKKTRNSDVYSTITYIGLDKTEEKFKKIFNVAENSDDAM